MFIKEYNNTAIVYGEEKISYIELIENVKDYSAKLAEYKKKRIAIFFENRPEWLYAFFAGWNIGAVNVLIDMMSTAEEVKHIVTDSKSSVIFASDKNIDVLRKALRGVKEKPVIINIDKFKVPKRKKDVKEYEAKDDETIMMLYTSGTTGKSKGVMLTKSNIYKNIHWNNDAKRINNTDVMISILPNHHSWPLISTILCPIECGATTVLLKELRGDILLKTIKDNHVTMVTAVPRLFEMLYRGLMDKINKSFIARVLLAFCRFLYKIPFNRILFGRVKFPHNNVIDIIPLTRIIFSKVHKEFGGNLKTFISGGAKLDDSLIDNFRAMGIIMLEGYGLTETAPMVTYHPFDKLRKGSAGKIFDEIDYRVEEDGELLVKGPNLFKGYWKNPKATKEAFTEDGFFKTGDLAVVDKERYLFITGRKKDLIILPNGKNVRPDQIENKLRNSFSIVEDAAVAEINGKLFGIIVPAASEIRKHGDDRYEIIKHLVFEKYNSGVENYKKIQNFIVTNDEIPKTRMGKVQRYKLKDFVESQSLEKKKTKTKIPTFKEYSLLSEQLKSMTGTDVFPEDHLEIDLGLDSLSLMELQLFIENSFGIEFSEGQIYNYSSVNELAEFMRENKTTVKKAKIDWKSILIEDIDWNPPRKVWMMKLANTLFRFFYKRGLHLKGSGVDNIPDGPCIFAPNHSSYLDSMVMYTLLKRKHKQETYFFAKEKNFKNKFLNFFADRSKVIMMDINKDLKESLQKIAKVLKEGDKIVIFPEGTRTKTGDIGKFKKTFATISKEMKIPVVPVVIKGTFEAMPYTKKTPGRGNVSVEFLEPVSPEKKTDSKIMNEVYKMITEKL